MLHLVSVHWNKVRHGYREIKVSRECKRQIRLCSLLHVFNRLYL